MMELIAVTYDQERTVMVRDRTSNNYIAPVGTWRTADGRWFSLPPAISHHVLAARVPCCSPVHRIAPRLCMGDARRTAPVVVL